MGTRYGTKIRSSEMTLIRTAASRERGDRDWICRSQRDNDTETDDQRKKGHKMSDNRNRVQRMERSIKSIDFLLLPGHPRGGGSTSESPVPRGGGSGDRTRPTGFKEPPECLFNGAP